MIAPFGRNPLKRLVEPLLEQKKKTSSSASGATATPPQSQGWTPGKTSGAQKVAGPAAPPPPPKYATFSELLQGFEAVAKNPSLSHAQREAAVDHLRATATAMGIGGDNPFMPMVNTASADALKLNTRQRADYLTGQAAKQLFGKLSGDLGPPMPAVPTRIAFQPAKAGQLGTSNALLGAQVSLGAYGTSKERILSMMRGQFDSAKVVDGHPLGARALVGTRTTGGQAMTMVAFRGTNNGPDAMRDAMMGSLTLDSKGKPCFKLKNGSDGYGAGAVHAGFAEHLDTVWPGIRADILDAARNNRTVSITGHSLGAATAELAMARALNDPEVAAALQASKAEPKAMLETFAQPSVGDAAFEKDFKGKLDAMGIPFHTYGFRNDPVMQVPPTGLPDARGRTFARPSAEFAQLDSGPSGATLSRGRPPADVKQTIRTGDLSAFVADATAFVKSATSADANGYSKLADHAPQNYWGALVELSKRS